MKKKNRIVVANWKMNPESPENARAIFLGTKRVGLKLKRTQTVICPPQIYFGSFVKLTKPPKVTLGVQNVFWGSSGPFTGEINPTIVKKSEGTHVIVGHSERREMGETPDQVNKKAIAVLREGLSAIVCVGEKERDSHGDYLAFIKDQLSSSLSGLHKRFVNNLIIAYEPVWAIGKSDRDAMKGSEMHEMLLYIRKLLYDMFGADYAEGIPILYGGSVSPINAEDIVRNGKVNGLLVGRQSLDPKQFGEILKIVDTVE